MCYVCLYTYSSEGISKTPPFQIGKVECLLNYLGIGLGFLTTYLMCLELVDLTCMTNFHTTVNSHKENW